MSTVKKYRLLKDLPLAKAGATFTYDKERDFYVLDGCPDSVTGTNKIFNHGYPSKQIENTPEWFELVKEDRIEVKLERKRYSDPRIKSWDIIIVPSRGIAEWQLPLIKEAIEQILNDKPTTASTEQKEEKRQEFIKFEPEHKKFLDMYCSIIDGKEYYYPTTLIWHEGNYFKTGQKLYTQQQMDKAVEDAFSESRKTHPMLGFKHHTLNDYLKSKQQSSQ